MQPARGPQSRLTVNCTMPVARLLNGGVWEPAQRRVRATAPLLTVRVPEACYSNPRSRKRRRSRCFDATFGAFFRGLLFECSALENSVLSGRARDGAKCLSSSSAPSAVGPRVFGIRRATGRVLRFRSLEENQ
jgi:hypothetical protein